MEEDEVLQNKITGDIGGKVEQRLTKDFPKIFIIRHAESVSNRDGVYQGQSYDSDLSELGKRQAKALAKRLKNIGVKRIISSPLKRAYQTALEISREIDREIEIIKEIIETNHGDWEGKSKGWIEKNYPKEYLTWKNNPAQTVFPGGESFMETVERVKRFIASHNFRNDSVIITHDNIVRIITIFSMGDDPDNIWKYKIEPAALNVFEIVSSTELKLKPVVINDSQHLSAFRADLSNHAP